MTNVINKYKGCESIKYNNSNFNWKLLEYEFILVYFSLNFIEF